MTDSQKCPAAILMRMARAVHLVEQRLLRATAALRRNGVPYAVIGDAAVAAWVATVDEAAVRNTRDVDILIRREDLDQAREALEGAGFIYRRVGGLDIFLEDASSSVRQAVHLVFAGERVRADEPAANPDVSRSEDLGPFRVATLEALVQIKLTAFRDKDRTHLRDLIDVGLLDATWIARLPAPLAERLQQLLDTPGG